MLGVEDHGLLEGVHDHLLRDVTEAHVQEVLRIVHMAVRSDGRQTAPAAHVGGDDGGQHRKHPQRLGVVRLGAAVLLIAVFGTHVADQRAHRVHRVAGVRQLRQ